MLSHRKITATVASPLYLGGVPIHWHVLYVYRNIGIAYYPDRTKQIPRTTPLFSPSVKTVRPYYCKSKKVPLCSRWSFPRVHCHIAMGPERVVPYSKFRAYSAIWANDGTSIAASRSRVLQQILAHCALVLGGRFTFNATPVHTPIQHWHLGVPEDVSIQSSSFGLYSDGFLGTKIFVWLWQLSSSSALLTMQ